MSRIARVLAVVLPLLLPSPGHALFHISVIDEVMTSYGGDPSAQFVEIRMLAASQTLTANSVLASFDAAGNYTGDVLVVPGNVANGGAGVRWIMGTTQFQTVSGLAADFTMPASLPTAGGMICWGAPGILPPAPGSWDHTNPLNYVDCVAYGTYSGPSNLLVGTPTPLDADGHSLVRTTETNNNANDFACGDPLTPTNNAGTTVTLAATTPCTAPQTMETKLLLVKNPGAPASRKIIYKVKEDAPNPNTVTGDPTGGGAKLKIKLDAASQCFDMPSTGWSAIGAIGFKYKDPQLTNGPVKVALVKKAPSGVFLVKVILKGSGISLVPPDPGTQADTNLHLEGGGDYCGSTAGAPPSPNDDKTFKVKDATAPAACNVTACP